VPVTQTESHERCGKEEPDCERVPSALPDADGDTLVSVRGASYLVHRGPLAGAGHAAGTVLTFQESRAVERLDRTLRSRQRGQQFTARYRLERPDGLVASQAWRERLPVEMVGERHRLRVLPSGDGPGELHLGPPRADDELAGASGG